MPTIELTEICNSCKGTGLYVGMAERNGAAVVCHICKGTGCHKFKHEYEEFTERKEIKGIKRVYEVNPGIIIGEGGDIKLEDFGGISFEDWNSGDKFPIGSEDRKYTCPSWWYQSADYKKKPSWKECTFGGTFSSCRHFNNKEKCWERFDKISQ